MTISLTSLVSRSNNQVETKIEDETLMMSIERGMYYGVKETAQSVWDMLKTTISVSEIVRNLLEEYDVNEETCQKEVLALLDQMKSEGLIEVS